MNPFMFPVGASMAPPAPQAPPPNPWGVLSNPANAQTLMNFGANMLAASGPSLQPSNFGKALGQSIAMTQNFRDQFDRSKARQALLAAQTQNIQADTGLTGLQIGEMMQPQHLRKLDDFFGKATPESIRSYIESGDPRDLVPIEKDGWQVVSGVVGGSPVMAAVRGGTAEEPDEVKYWNGKDWITAPKGTYRGEVSGDLSAVTSFSKPATTELEKGIIEDQKLLNELLTLKDHSVDTARDYLTFEGKITDWALRMKDFFVGSIPEQKEKIMRNQDFRSGIEIIFQKLRKKYTGAQAALKELRWLQDATLSTRMGPAQFEGAYERLVQFQRDSIAAGVLMRERGLDGLDPETAEYQSALDQAYLDAREIRGALAAPGVDNDPGWVELGNGVRMREK